MFLLIQFSNDVILSSWAVEVLDVGSVACRQVDSEALIGCREAMSQLGERRSARRCPRGRAGSPRGSGAGSPPRAERSCSAKRKVDEMEEDDVYDGIRRLYDGDDAAMPCGREARQEGGGAAVTLPTAAANWPPRWTTVMTPPASSTQTDVQVSRTALCKPCIYICVCVRTYTCMYSFVYMYLYVCI